MRQSRPIDIKGRASAEQEQIKNYSAALTAAGGATQQSSAVPTMPLCRKTASQHIRLNPMKPLRVPISNCHNYENKRTQTSPVARRTWRPPPLQTNSIIKIYGNSFTHLTDSISDPVPAVRASLPALPRVSGPGPAKESRGGRYPLTPPLSFSPFSST